jgi:hypothetical protein
MRPSHRIDVDADGACPHGLGGGNHDAAIAASEVINDIAFLHAREFQHRLHGGFRGGHVRHIRHPQALGLLSQYHCEGKYSTNERAKKRPS